MSMPTTSSPGLLRCPVIALALVIATGLAVLPPSQLLAADPSPVPEVAASPVPIATSQAVCDSVADLRLIVGFLRDTDVSEDGWLPVFVGTVAALSEARQLADALGETYRPLFDDLIASLEGLRATVDELAELETTGSQVASIGEAITAIGNAMDALSVQLRTPCPVPSPDAIEAAEG
jgi:hypothetical protein